MLVSPGSPGPVQAAVADHAIATTTATARTAAYCYALVAVGDLRVPSGLALDSSADESHRAKYRVAERIALADAKWRTTFVHPVCGPLVAKDDRTGDEGIADCARETVAGSFVESLLEHWVVAHRGFDHCGDRDGHQIALDPMAGHRVEVVRLV